MNTRRGFTLIEMLVVIAIIGVMATFTLILISPNNIRAKLRDSQRLHNLRTYDTAIKDFYISTGRYPDISSRDCGSDPGRQCTIKGETFCIDTSLSPEFLDELNDLKTLMVEDIDSPREGDYFTNRYGNDVRLTYIYLVTTDHSKYKLYTYLEKDLKKMENDGGNCDVAYEIGSDLSLPARGSPCSHSGVFGCPGNAPGNYCSPISAEIDCP
jgi:prepilin-type N-terminal cleavage/methylation domain-containing protein